MQGERPGVNLGGASAEPLARLRRTGKPPPFTARGAEMTFARIRALTLVGLLAVSAMVLVAMALVKDRQAHGVIATGCPKGAVLADTRLREPQDVKINVYNSTDRPDLALQVATELEHRKFKIVNKPSNDPKGKRVDQVAVLRYGPKAVGSAWLLRAYFLDQAVPEFDINRTDDVVDVVLGTQFKKLATVTEFNQALAQLGNPTLPKGTCDANAR
jgi:hypothetical protein